MHEATFLGGTGRMEKSISSLVIIDKRDGKRIRPCELIWPMGGG